jgi:DNA repair protein RadC
VWIRFTGNPPASKLESDMRGVIKSLTIKPDSGRVDPKGDSFTSGLVRETAGAYVLVSDDAVVDAALKILARRVAKGCLLSSPNAVKTYLRMRFADLQYEVFCLLYLDKRNHLICCEELFRGTVDGASVHPREVVKAALRHNAAGVVCAHNHPSNCAEPSHADELITQRLKSALELVDIRLIDHLVVCVGESVSFAERGLI